MTLSIKDNWVDALDNHRNFLNELIEKKLSLATTHKDYIKSPAARQFLNDHKNVIIEGTAEELKYVIHADIALKAAISEHQYKNFMSSIRKVFDYDSFVKKDKKSWNAYSLLNASKCKICPYCIQSYAFTVVTPEGAFRPTIDHYFSKSTYPYLALSLSNLIPSCYTCNSNLKGNKDFFQNSHLNPLSDQESINFRLDIKDIKYRLDAIFNPDIYLTHGSLSVLSSGEEKCVNTINTFLLDHRYEGNLSIFVAFLKAKKNYIHLKNLLVQLGHHQEISEATMLQFDKNNYKNYLFGPILRDLHNQFP